MKKKLTAFQTECLERRARGAAAWGAYGAHVRQSNLTQSLRTYEEAIRRADTREKREHLISEKDKLIEQSRVNRLVHIGPF